MRLIVNADDLGYSPAVNEAILTLYHAGRLTSASVIVNLQHSPDGMAAARAARLPVGVHLNLTRGRPILPPEMIRSLVDANGAFYASPAFFARAMTGLIRTADIEAECRAQIDCALAQLDRVAHLDSHSHWHLVPPFGRVVRQLACSYGLERVRTAELRRTLYPNPFWLAMVNTAPARQARPTTLDYLLSLHHWLDKDANPIDPFSGRHVCRLFRRDTVTAELVTHPGRAADPDFPVDTLPGDRRQREVDFLLSPAFSRWLARVGAEMSQPVRRSTE